MRVVVWKSISELCGKEQNPSYCQTFKESLTDVRK